MSCGLDCCHNTFREINSLADALTNLGLSFDMLRWWSTFPDSIGQFLSNDAAGLPCYRFC